MIVWRVPNLHCRRESSRSRSSSSSADERTAPGLSPGFGAGSAAAILIFAALWLVVILTSQSASAEDNILLNGDVSKGAGESPDHWHGEGWKEGAEFTTFRWKHAEGTPGELEISNLKPNDARWVQTVHLGPGWYRFSAGIRTESVAEGHTGAALSVLEDGIISRDLHGTNDWQTVEFYLKVGEKGADIPIACRLGGYAGLNTGKASCRDLKGVKIAAPPADARYKYDLDLIRGGGPPRPVLDNSKQVTVLALLAMVVLAVLLGWRRFGNKALQRLRLVARMGSQQESAPRIPANRDQRRIEITLFLVSFLTFAYFYQASDHSTASRFDLIRSITERHTFWIEGYAGYNTADIVELNSHVYSNKAPGGAFTGLLPWTVVTTILHFLFSAPNGLYWALATHLTTIFSVSVPVAGLIVLMYRFAMRLGAGNGRAAAMALTLAFATIMFPYATELTGEPIAAFCVFAAFYILARPEGVAGLWESLFSGLLAGWAVLCDYPTSLLAVIVGLYALWKLRDWRETAAFALGAAAVAVVMLAYNKFAFGNPLFLSYEAYMLPGSTHFPEQSVGFAGVTYPRLPILWNVLFGAQRGLFFCNPVLLLAIPGLAFFWRRRPYRPEFVVVAFSIVSFVLFNASYGQSIIYWGGGTATGPRHMLSAVPFMILAMAFLPRRLNYIFGALALLSAFLMLITTSVEPHLPYEYQNPLRDFVWPAYLRGDLAYNKSTYFGGGPIAGDSVAFNLGKLAGLPGAMQLLPLAAIWLAAALDLLGNLDWWQASRRRMAPAATALAIIALFTPPIVGASLQRPGHSQTNGLLGRYYEGLRPSGFPPHIQRVDKEIAFNNIAEMGALPSPSFVLWTGKLMAPTTGLYHFKIAVDDAGWLKIDGRPVIDDPGNVLKPHDDGSIQLTSGAHSIEIGERNIWGDAWMRFLWQPPGGVEEVVPSRFLIPES